MFTEINEAIDWVIVQKKGENSRERFKQYLHEKGDPQLKLKTIHVAGTNGKGSTTNYIRNILQTAGYKVGSFTSPHLVTHLDRIRINDVNIDEQYFINIVNENMQQWQSYGMSMFQIDMYISICYFLDNNVDIVVYEVGMGGIVDATNVISPIGAVITNIEMDHMSILGNTIAEIAEKKAGIIKDNLDVVTFEKKPEALQVFYETANQHNANIICTDEAENVMVTDHIEYDYHNYHVTLPTRAVYQVLNSSAALTLIELLVKKGEIQVSDQQLIDGLNTNWAGRFEVVRTDPLVIIDGAHNENGIDGLCASLDNFNEEYIIVFSALRDKNYHSMLEKLTSRAEVIVTQFEAHRRETAENLAMGFDVEVIEDYKEAIEVALSKNKTVILTGSLYFVSFVRDYFVK